MKNSKPLILPLFFLAILLLPVIAIAVLQIGQNFIKSNREERLAKERLVQVVVPAKNLLWEEEGKELWVGDKMFDVASYTIKNGSYHLTGVYDDKETRIAASLFHCIFKKNTQLLQLLLLLQCFLAVFIMAVMSIRFAINKHLKAFYFTLLPSPPHFVLVPPPWQ